MIGCKLMIANFSSMTRAAQNAATSNSRSKINKAMSMF